MSTNRGPPEDLANGFNGFNNESNSSHDGTSSRSVNGIERDHHGSNLVVPPTRPSSPQSGTTPRVLLGPRIAEAPSRHELIRTVPTAHPPFFEGITAYTHSPLPPRGILRGGSSNGARVNGSGTNGTAPSASVPRSGRYLTVPGQDGPIVSALEGLKISSCSDDVLIPTPQNTPAATPGTSPITIRRVSGRRTHGTNPVTPSPPSTSRRVSVGHTDSPYPGLRYDDHTPPAPSPQNLSSSTMTAALGLQVPHTTPVTPSVSPQRSTTSSDGRVDTPRPSRRVEPAVFGPPLNPTRLRGGGSKKKQKSKLSNGKLTNGKAKPKGSAKDKMLDDSALAVAHGESPIYSTNIAAVLQHPEAAAVLSSAPGFDPIALSKLMASSEFKDAVAAFVENGKAGQNDPEFLEEAHAASERRAKGEFDEMLEDHFMVTWAVEDGKEEESTDEEGGL